MSEDQSVKFYAKPAKFESKSQVAPNSIIFHRELSSEAKIFLLALNGIATCTHSWIPIQSDLQKRLNFGRDKMKNVIKECVRLGFLKVRQKKEKGKFGHHEFEFDLEGGYLKIEDESSQEKCPENDVSPATENQSTENIFENEKQHREKSPQIKCPQKAFSPATEKPAPVNPLLPYTRHRPNPGDVYGVIDSEPSNEAQSLKKQARSMTPLKNPKRRSMAAPFRFKLDETQTASFEYLKSLNLEGTQESRLTWWAKNYPLRRLTEAYMEAQKRKADNLGAYMSSLLEKATSLTVGRVEANRKLAEDVKKEYKWNELKIYSKFAILENHLINIEIPFDVDAMDFYNNLENKYNTYKKR